MPALRCKADLQALFDGRALVAAVPIGTSLDGLGPVDLAPVVGAVESRRREYATGRFTARRLLGDLEMPAVAPGRSTGRAPVWPSGVVGSIAHCRDTCVVAVARSAMLRALGVDVEPDMPIESELWPTICTTEERAWLGEQDPGERGRLVRMIFSAKEAVYKCLSPIVGRIFEFEEISLTFHAGCDRFTAAPRGQSWDAHGGDGGPLVRAVEGRVVRLPGLVLTGAFIPGTPHG